MKNINNSNEKQTRAAQRQNGRVERKQQGGRQSRATHPDVEERKSRDTYVKKEAEDFPNLGKETDVQVQKAQRVSNKMDPKIAPARNIIIKMSKIKAS